MLLARRNLFRDRARFVLSVLGVSVAVMLIVILAGYRSGVYRQATAYLDNTPGSVVVAERGIRDFLGTTSVLPPSAEPAVRQAPGIQRAIPVVSQFVIFERHGRKDGFFLIGYDPAIGGGPWRLVEGRQPATDDELVLDRTTARQHAIAVGDRIGVLDREVTVVGFSDETTFWAGSIAFARITALESLLRAPGLRSFLLVTPEPGLSPETARDALDVPGTEVLLKTDLVANDRRLLARVYDGPIGLMVAIAFVIGVLVVGIVIYTATIERRREFGVLKAIGAPNRTLYRIVVAQALISAATGAFAGIVFAYGVAAFLVFWRPQFRIDIEPATISVVLIAGLLMAAFAALIPARALSRLEPAEVFR